MKTFEIGKLVATRGIMDIIETETISDNDFRTFVNSSFKRYLNCDWGEISQEDKNANDEAVEKGKLRIFAEYTNPRTNQKIWIITEADRSYTTILFPDEY